MGLSSAAAGHNGYVLFASSGYCYRSLPVSSSRFESIGIGRSAVRNRTRFTGVRLLLLLLAFLPAGSSAKSEKNKVVYVCACLKTKSCFCMTEAKMQGPCACGTEGGPPMKAVPTDSEWAKQNRDALAK